MSKKISWTKLFGYMLLGFFIFWVCYGHYKGFLLKRNYKITTGQVNHIGQGGYKNNNRSVDYEYFVAGKKIWGENGIKACDNYSILDLSRLIVNRKFTVAYDSTDITSSVIILTEKQADKFDIIISDTLLHYDSLLNYQQTFGDY